MNMYDKKHQQHPGEEEIKLLSNASSDGAGNEQEEEESRRKYWWKKVLDVKEAKKQILFSLPMILTNVFYYLIPLVSVMFAGHLGELELAGATLANSWATVTGFAFMVILQPFIFF